MRWTEAEVKQLRVCLSEGKTVPQIVDLLGKSYAAVRKKVKTLGLIVNVYAHRWTDIEDTRLREEYAKAESIDALAKSFGLSISQIKNRAVFLKLKRQRRLHANFHGTRAGALKREQNPKLKVAKSLWMKKIWEEPAFRAARMAEALAAMTPEKKQKMLSGKIQRTQKKPIERRYINKDPRVVAEERLKRLAELNKKQWANPEYVKKLHAGRDAYFADPENRRKHSECSRAVRLRPDVCEKLRQVQTKGSSIERIVWRLVDSFGLKEGVDWVKHVSIGYYQIDIEVKRPGKRSLLIECQGDYWHTLDRVIHSDRAKKTYIETYFSNTHELMYLWEHEFLMEGKICAKLKRGIFGNSAQVKEFEFSSLEVKEAPREQAAVLVEDYHYLSRIGRGGVYIGCYLQETLIAAAVFAGTVRQTTPKSLGYKNLEVLELSRFVIHPEYQKPNLGSWFLSRAITVLQKIRPEVLCLVSFSDENQGHSGSLYKAAGWETRGAIAPDYWYVDSEGFVTSKKKAYMMARKMKQTERAFTEEKGWKKVYGFGKLKFVKILSK